MACLDRATQHQEVAISTSETKKKNFSVNPREENALGELTAAFQYL